MADCIEDSGTRDCLIRDAVSEDLPAINALQNAIGEEGHQLWSQERSLEHHKEWLNTITQHKYPALVAEQEDGTVIALAAFSPWSTFHSTGTLFDAKMVVCVSQSHRRCGLATRLFEALCAHDLCTQRQIYLIRCLTLSTNYAAIGWLEQIGFDRRGSLEDIAERDGPASVTFYTKFIGAAPNVSGLGWPEQEHEMSTFGSFTLPLDLQSADFGIKPVCWGDLKALTDIYNWAMLHTEAHSYYAAFTLEERAVWLTDVLRKDEICLVAHWQNRAIGFLHLSQPFEEEADCIFKSQYISLYINPLLLRQRVGEALWLAMLDSPALLERKIRYLIADVSNEVNNQNAIGYAAILKLGFVPKSHIPRCYFKRGELKGGTFFQKEIAQRQSGCEQEGLESSS